MLREKARERCKEIERIKKKIEREVICKLKCMSKSRVYLYKINTRREKIGGMSVKYSAI